VPAAGNRWNGDLNNAGENGNYWSSTQNPSYSDYAYGLYFNSGLAYWNYYNRYDGRSVRPVVSTYPLLNTDKCILSFLFFSNNSANPKRVIA
jgi:hypothetical protein